MENSKFNNNEDLKLLKPSEVAQILNISKSYAYKLIQTRTLPFIRIGKSVRVNYHDLLNFINSSKEPVDNTIIQKKIVPTVSLTYKFNKLV